ncbi:hypothetical protein EON81_23850 [bacterium]|nr:MAG: hypothetical protein EON81_23850 [bacterium]
MRVRGLGEKESEVGVEEKSDQPIIPRSIKARRYRGSEVRAERAIAGPRPNRAAVAAREVR